MIVESTYGVTRSVKLAYDLSCDNCCFYKLIGESCYLLLENEENTPGRDKLCEKLTDRRPTLAFNLSADHCQHVNKQF